MRSLLGLVNYCQRFIPDYATITDPLTRQSTTWIWTPRQQEAFEPLKDALTADTVISYFDPNLDTEVIVDASPIGQSTILLQHSQTGVKVVSFGSRSLSPVERRYLQTERESLAEVFGCETFHLYVYGDHFTVATDQTIGEHLLKSSIQTICSYRMTVPATTALRRYGEVPVGYWKRC